MSSFLTLKRAFVCSGLGFFPTSMVYGSYGFKGGLRIYSFEGSSSMKSAMDLLLFAYGSAENIGTNIQTIGSSGGLEKVLSGKADFALVSHDVSDYKTKYHSIWNAKKIRTLTLAKELMTIVYKPPRGCNSDLVISKDNVNILYSMFSGYKHRDVSSSDFSALMSSKEECKSEVKAWVRSSGPTKSGTATAFVNNPLLNQNQDSAWLAKVKGPNYGTEIKTLVYAPESNSLAFNNFVKNLKHGSMIYLPSSFVFTNWDFINNLGLKVAKFKNTETEITLDKSNFKQNLNNYKWERKFNLLYSALTLSGDEKKKKLLKHIVDNVGGLEALNLIPESSCCSDIEKGDQDTATATAS